MTPTISGAAPALLTPLLAFLPLIVAWLALVLLAWTAESWLTPRPRAVLKRTFSANSAHALVLLSSMGFLMTITARAGLSAGLAFAVVMLLVLVNQDKQESLREPFLACDFVYFLDVIRHHKLFLPYFGYGKAVVLALGMVAVVSVWWFLEPALVLLPDALGYWPVRLFGLALGVGMGWVAILLATRLSRGISFNPSTDLKQLGLMAMLAAYRMAAVRPRIDVGLVLNKGPYASLSNANRRPIRTHAPGQSGAPLVICLQVESFADFRRTYADQHSKGIDHFELPAWDQLCQEAWVSGLLTVPAFGANTVRSEFEFLMGVPVTQMGVDGFEPYQWIARQKQPCFDSALPAALARCGYSTHFMHPYAMAFYQRDRVLPKLGFELFNDIKSFETSPEKQAFDAAKSVNATGGSEYITDVVLGRSILKKIRDLDLDLDRDQPAFIHAVTMQGHGPYVALGSPHTPEALIEGYLACLRDTDRMLCELRSALKAMSRQAVLCVFGDHVPILPAVYNAWGLPDGKTDYLIWRNGSPEDGRRTDYACHELGTQVLKAAGFTLDG